MSTKENLISVGLLAAGGAAIAAASGVYSKGSRAHEGGSRASRDTTPKARRTVTVNDGWFEFDDEEVRFEQGSVYDLSQTSDGWPLNSMLEFHDREGKLLAKVYLDRAWPVLIHGSMPGEALHHYRRGKAPPEVADEVTVWALPQGARGSSSVLGALASKPKLAIPGSSLKGSSATTWEPKGDDFRRADVTYPDEVEVLYVSELRMYLPYVKCAGHVLSFDAALPLARAKTEASQAYDTQRSYNDYVGRNPYSKSRSKS